MPTSEALTPERERALLFTLAGIQFAHILDFMIMMPLGPILINAFGVTTHEFGLLVSAYTFSAAFTGILAAVFVDRFERKRLLLTIFGFFAVATLACGLAVGYWSLLVARCIAGAFGGVLGSMVQTMVGDLIPFERRGRATGTVMSAFSISTVAGVPLSLYFANHFGWRFPFIFIAAMAVALLVVAVRILPTLRGHLPTAIISEAERRHPLSAMWDVVRDANHLRAFVLMALIIFSGFTLIPYITIYLTANVGIAQADIPFVYLAGGCATFFTSRLIGRLADKHGKVRVYRAVAAGSMLPIFMQTNMVPLPLWIVLISTTLFFVLVPGRMVPAMAIVTSAAQSRLRGTFMSMNGAIQSLASGTASFIGGTMISVSATGGRGRLRSCWLSGHARHAGGNCICRQHTYADRCATREGTKFLTLVWQAEIKRL